MRLPSAGAWHAVGVGREGLLEERPWRGILPWRGAPRGRSLSPDGRACALLGGTPTTEGLRQAAWGRRETESAWGLSFSLFPVVGG